jgi:predicted ATPase/DNA-binding SARP family transcriptional activator
MAMSSRCRGDAVGVGSGGNITEPAKLSFVGFHAMVEYRLLGPMEVVVDGVCRPLAGYRQHLLLAALVLADGREVTDEHLVELLWEEEPPRSPHTALRSQVARLRRAIGPAVLGLTYGVRGYSLPAHGLVDVQRFEALVRVALSEDRARALDAATEALKLWRSTELTFAASRVLQPTAVRLLERRAALIERRADLLMASERAGEAIAELQPLVLEQPAREAARALLMEALCQGGRPTEALDVYRSWLNVLNEERGLEPSLRLRELESRVLRHEVSQRSPGSPLASTLPATATLARGRGTFIGREGEVEKLVAALREHQVVTLVGPGGVGKTRLAWEVVERLGDHVGTVLDIDLSAVDERTDVMRLIAGAVGVKDVTGRTLLEQVVERIAATPCLLVLDNCEHVVDEVWDFVMLLVRRTTSATVLATSQRRLGVAGEWLWDVQPLDASGPESPAVRLFLERAGAASRRYAPGEDGIERVQRICIALDGLPLAIEIAAAQMSALSLSDLEAELEHRLELHAPGATEPWRHRTLRAVVDWSFRRLADREQRALERLSIFVGAFDLAAARALLRDLVADGEVAACIVQLVDRSLLTFEIVDEHGRYRMLQGVRAFGLDRLRADAQLVATQARHAQWAVTLVEDAAQRLPHDELATVRCLERSFDDLRTAHHWLVAYDASKAMRLIDALHPYAFWHSRTEVFRWAEVATAVDCQSDLRASVTASVCAGAWLRGDLAGAERAARAALAAVTEPEAPWARRAYGQVAEIALLNGDAPRCVEMYDRAYQLDLQTDDIMQATWDLGSSALILHYTGRVAEANRRAAATVATAERIASPSARSFAAFVLGELAATCSPQQAKVHLERALHLADTVNNRFVAALARVTLASLVRDGEGDVGPTAEHYKSALASWDHIGARCTQWVTIRNVVGLLTENAAFEQAATLYGAVIAAASASPLYGADRAKMDRVRATLDRELGTSKTTELAARGGQLTNDDIIAYTMESLDQLTR